MDKKWIAGITKGMLDMREAETKENPDIINTARLKEIVEIGEFHDEFDWNTKDFLEQHVSK